MTFPKLFYYFVEIIKNYTSLQLNFVHTIDKDIFLGFLTRNDIYEPLQKFMELEVSFFFLLLLQSLAVLKFSKFLNEIMKNNH